MKKSSTRAVLAVNATGLLLGVIILAWAVWRLVG
jgi:hypothetical protein